MGNHERKTHSHTRTHARTHNNMKEKCHEVARRSLVTYNASKAIIMSLPVGEKAVYELDFWEQPQLAR
jgi:hypothetical protein